MSILPASIPATIVQPEQVWNPVHPALLHKRSLVEVFLTHHRDAGEEQQFRVVIPRVHSMVTDEHVPTILGVEAVRQVGLALCQVHGGVPADWAVILQEASLIWAEEPPVWDHADHLVLEVRCRITEKQLRGDVVTMIAAHTELLQQGRLVASGGGRIRNLPRRAYEALRRRASTTSDHAHPCGAATLSKLSTTERGVRAVLGWTHPDPFFFDHPVDHVPGMLFAQAALDAHFVLRDRPARGVNIECGRFAELDEPVAVTSQLDGPQCTTVFTQCDQEIARATTV